RGRSTSGARHAATVRRASHRGAHRHAEDHGTLRRRGHRASSDLRHSVRDRHSQRAAVSRAGGEGSRAGGGQSSQIAIPRQHVARAAYADERDPRLHGTHRRRNLRHRSGADAGRLDACRCHWPPPPRPHQRPAGSLEDRGGPADAHAGGLFDERSRRGRRRLGGGPGGGEEPPPGRGRAAEPPRRTWRSAPARPGAAEPRRQRDQVHRAGSGRDPRRRGGRPVHRRRERLRSGDRDRRSGANLRGAPTSRHVDDTSEGWDRARARDRPADRQHARRQDLGGVGSRRGCDVPFHDTGQGRSAGRPARRGDVVTRTILVVDDHEDNRRILRDLLRSGGYEVIEATTGEDGVAAAKARTPDLILMDIQLPGIDGYEATRRIKADEALRRIPLIVVTSYALSGDDAKALAAGADAYVAKPVSPRAMLTKVREYLREGRPFWLPPERGGILRPLP